MDRHEQYMQKALALAARARGRTSPNPMVGCVIVRAGAIIGEGYHQRAGEPHAEINALADAGEVAGADVYVTLEPCCHRGRTGPCTEALIAARPARVIVAMLDPNPLVAGKGVAQLRDAGIDVEVGVLEPEAKRLNEVFIKYITTGMPFVISKCGMSLDGKIATHTGDSKWVTGEVARQKVHELRNEVDAILVGSRTVMTDDPSLTTRLDDCDARDPVRVVLDADAYLSPDRRIFTIESEAPTWVAVPEGETVPPGATQLTLTRDARGEIDVAELMRELGRREITSVLIEGGGQTHATAFESGVVDKVMFFIAPKIIGGRDAVSAVDGNGANTMSEAILLTDMTATPVGDDILIEAYVKK